MQYWLLAVTAISINTNAISTYLFTMTAIAMLFCYYSAIIVKTLTFTLLSSTRSPSL